MSPDLRFEHAEWLWAAPLLALAAALLERRASRSKPRAAWRALLVGLAGLALAGPRSGVAGAPRSFVLIDRSASVAGLSRSLALEALDPLQPFLSLDFGDEVGSPVGATMAQLRDLVQAGDRVLLLSDCLWNHAGSGAGVQGAWEPVAAATKLAAQGARVDVVVLDTQAGPGLALWAADGALRGGREGDLVPLRLRAASDRPRSGRLSLRTAGRILAEQSMELRSGPQELDLAIGGLRAGAWPLEARLEASGVPSATLELGLTVASAPRVLVVGGGSLPAEVARALAGIGLSAQAAGFADLPGRRSPYGSWEVVLLLDPGRGDLGFDQMEALEAQVQAGGGLLLAGGPNSFDAGAWQGSALERLSPLDLETPPRRERPPLALSFLIDRSASMGSVEGRGRTSKIDLARDAVLLAAQTLLPGDRMGLLAFDAEALWLLEPAVLGTGRESAELEAALAGVGTAGGTNIGAALDLALPTLLPAPDRPASHAILVTDGQDFASDHGLMLARARTLREAGAALSTIALGADADRTLLADLAAAGGGRFYAAQDPSDLPRLAASEGKILSGGAEQRGVFRAVPPPGPWSAALAAVDVATLPPLQAYRSLKAKEGLRPILQLAGGDPLLIVWPRGQGQVAAFSSSLDPKWTADWLSSEAAITLLSTMLRQVARAPEATLPQVRLRRTAEADLLHVSGLAHAAQQETRVFVEGVRAPLRARPAGPGTLVAELPGAAPGVRLGELRRAGHPSQPFAVAASSFPEVLPGLPADRRLLEQVASAGGGRVLTAAEAAKTLPQESAARPWPLSRQLLGLAALLWLLDLFHLLAPEACRRLARELPLPMPFTKGRS